MRYGVFGDIHGNLEALEAVLAALEAEAVDRHLCFGDIVGYGADPGACVERVRALGAVVVAGNHDLAAIDMLDIAAFNPFARKAIEWCRAALAPDHRAYLAGPNLVEVVDGELTLFHATLHRPESFEYLQTPADAGATLAFLRTPLGVFGHSHVPVAFRQADGAAIETVLDEAIAIPEGTRLLLNPGSVGQPRDGDPRAAYGVFDTATRTVSRRRVAYDVQRAQAKIRKAGLPEIISERLALGY